MGIKNVVRRIGNSAGDKVAKLAALSSRQVEEIQLKREEYLLEKHDPTDTLAVVNIDNAENNVDTNSYKDRLIEAIRGNFPGAEWHDEGMGIIPCMDNERPYSVAAASNIPTEKSEKFVSQTIEKLLDGIIPTEKKKEYTVVLLATPIKDVEERKLRLGEFYSGMAPYASWQTNYTYTENSAVGSSATVGVNVGASAGVQNGQNMSFTDSSANTENSSVTETESRSDSLSRSKAASESSGEAHSHRIHLPAEIHTVRAAAHHQHILTVQEPVLPEG